MAEAYEEPLLFLNNNTEKIDYEIIDALNGFDVNTMKKTVVSIYILKIWMIILRSTLLDCWHSKCSQSRIITQFWMALQICHRSQISVSTSHWRTNTTSDPALGQSRLGSTRNCNHGMSRWGEKPLWKLSLFTESTNFSFFRCKVRESYSKLGFTIRQVYHQQIIGSSLRVMKTQLGLDVVKYMAANVKNKWTQTKYYNNMGHKKNILDYVHYYCRTERL